MPSCALSGTEGMRLVAPSMRRVAYQRGAKGGNLAKPAADMQLKHMEWMTARNVIPTQRFRINLFSQNSPFKCHDAVLALVGYGVRRQDGSSGDSKV